MIQKVQITNFQSHHSTNLEFSSGVNSIIGASDSGKSAVLRAINWVINNKPQGTSFITRGKKTNKASVSIFLDSGVKIGRVRGVSENTYSIETKNGVKEFAAFRGETPDEVHEILDFNELNFQYQMDAPFLLSDTGGEVARFFNKLISLESIDRGHANAEKKRREVMTNMTTYQKMKKDLTEELSKFELIPELEESIKTGEELEYKMGELSLRKQAIYKQIRLISQTNELLQSMDASILNKLTDLVGSAEGMSKEIKHIGERLSHITKAVDSIIDYTELLERARSEYNALLIKYKSEFPEVCPLCGKGGTVK